MAAMPPVPVFEDPAANKGPTILVVCSVMTAVALFVVCLRVYVRALVVRSFGIDDIIMCVAITLSIAGFCVVIPEVHQGAGRHITALTRTEILTGLKLNLISQPLYLWVQTLCKISIGAFLLRLAVHKGFYYGILGIIAFLACYTTGAFFTIVLQCRPIERTWDRSVPGTCFSQETLQGLSYFNAVVAVMSDFTFAFLPIPMLWHIRINKREKLAVMGILGLGFFASAACIVKSVMIKDYGKNGDFLYDSANLTIWNCIEGNVGLVAASIPTLKPLFKALLGATGRSYNSDRQNITSGLNRKPTSEGYIRHKPNTDRLSRAEVGMYGMQSFGKGTKGDRVSGGTATKISCGASGTVSADDDSDQFILVKGAMSSSDSEHGIVKTTEISVVEDNVEYNRDGAHLSQGLGTNKAPSDWHTRFKH